jgi:ribonuclease VapC
MVIDSSAIVAILLLEPEAEHFTRLVERAGRARIAAPNLLEVDMVISSRKGPYGLDGVDDYLQRAGIETVPFTADHAAVAREAFLRYGKGRHPAGLNFGDCIAYATARLEDMPLLFKGDDFRLTDIKAAA